ncbi:uncharacterized protein LOC119092898 [Pollicipes pollicipes]|uniref:uncharacterized protein LOC119092898 n=1 Tax=Pollicipes pollicipes TaxID=41117 RepID=UPI001884D3C5|nr:uncharacterized protein LOC119092898 [Pollicipes pollicipes]
MKLIQINIVTLACLSAVSALISEPYITKFAKRKMADGCFSESVMAAFRGKILAAIDTCKGSDPVMQSELLAQYYAIVRIGGSRRKRSTVSSFSSQQLQDTESRISEMIERLGCVLKELKFANAQNRIDASSIKKLITSLGLPKSLREDLQEAVDQCNDFANCLPNSMVDKPPSTPEFGRQKAFFECFERAKAETCMKKEFQEGYLPSLQKENPAINADEAFQTIIMSFMVGDSPF